MTDFKCKPLQLSMTINHPPVWRIKVVLNGTKPAVWRRFDTCSTVTLSQLHYCIQGVMGWELAHLFSFHDELGRFEINNSLTLANVCRIGDTLRYVYDFGDDWEHLVTIEKEMRTCTGVVYPRAVSQGETRVHRRIVAGHGATPRC